MPQTFDQLFDQFWAETANLGWQHESRIAHAQNKMAAAYDRAYRMKRARENAAHEARFNPA